MKTQKELVLNYLETHEKMTMLNSILELGVNHPQHYIMELRREGYKITDIWVTNPTTKKHYKEYRLEV